MLSPCDMCLSLYDKNGSFLYYLYLSYSCVFLCTNYYNFKTSKNNIEGYFILKVDVMEKYLYFFLMFLFCVCGFVDFISLMIFGCTCSYNMSASERWIFEMKEGLKNKRITKKWIKRITDICSPQNTKGVGNLGSAKFFIEIIAT